MTECGMQCVLSIIVVGFIWGATNPMLRAASVSKKNEEKENNIFQIVVKFLKSFLNWKFSVPFALNQAGSIMFNVLVVNFPVTVVVPCVNAIQLISTVFVGRLMGEKTSISSQGETLGMILATGAIGGMLLFD